MWPDDLLAEGRRQLDICNSCRYCEGYCAVFPALERRADLLQGDLSQLANLCFDCRACFQACMYSEPHAFALNVPQILAEVRVTDYAQHVWPQQVPRWLRGWRGIATLVVAFAVIVVLAAAGNRGWGALVESREGASSPYDIIEYPLLLTILAAPALFAIVILVRAARSFWRASGPRLKVRPRHVYRALANAATMRFARGGGGDCYYPDDEVSSPGRRRLHHLVAYGFLGTLVSTASAAVMQDVLGIDPPYSLLSVPVIFGTVGGVAIVIGCIGLIRLKLSSSAVTSFAEMTVKDYGFLVALTVLSASGLLTLVTRSTPAFGIVLLAHLAAIEACFVAAPYSKFPHFIYRVLALIRNEAEVPR